MNAIRRQLITCMCLSVVLIAQGCSYLATSKRAPVLSPAVSLEGFSPAGDWIYEDRIATGLAELDEKGNGSYPWKGGYFVTEGWGDGVWRGTWHQPGNNREGGFEIYLSDDFSSGEGRWWYTRIGSDNSPSKSGGTFLLTRP